MNAPRTLLASVLLSALLGGCGGAMKGLPGASSRADMAPRAPSSAPADAVTESAGAEADDEAPARPSPAPAGGAAAGFRGPTAMPPPPPAAPQQQLAQNSPGKKEPTESNPGARPVEAQSPVVIYTATFTMAVFKVEESLKAMEGIARETGGFVSKRDDHSITFRVPAARFQEAVSRTERVGEVVHRNVAAQDVTEEYLDLGVRLRNARAMRDRLEQLLAKAANVQDSLAIERELGRVAGEIERIEGRLKFLRDRAAFSTLTVSFEIKRSDDPATPSVRLPFPWLQNLGLGRLLSL